LRGCAIAEVANARCAPCPLRDVLDRRLHGVVVHEGQRGRGSRDAVSPASGPWRWALVRVVAGSILALAPIGTSPAPTEQGGAGPQVSLHAPRSGSTISNVSEGGATAVAVSGTVGGVGLIRWTLDAGPGEAPSSWTRIAEGAAPVAGHSLGVWRTGTLANGPYVLRLQAWDLAGRGRETRVPVTLANFSLRQDRLELNATGGGVVTYTSVVPFPLTETLVIKDGTGRVVRMLPDAPRPAGTHADAWDGRDDAGARLPDGPYFVVATVTDGTHTTTWLA
jgi:hypothetical protein